MLAARIDRAADDVAHLTTAVRALSPASTLQRGYAVVQRADGTVVRSPGDVTARERLRLRLAEGEIAAEALDPAEQG
jgi:exodeoxyribonuclease VII large subunit